MFSPGFLGVQSLWTLQSIHLTGVGKGRAVRRRGVGGSGGVGRSDRLVCPGHASPERQRRELHACATVRGCPCPVAGRSLRHPAFARSMLTALRHPGCAGQQRRLSGHGQPLTDAATGGRQANPPANCRVGCPALASDRRSPRKNDTMSCFSYVQSSRSSNRRLRESSRDSWGIAYRTPTLSVMETLPSGA